jgi:hypothetical protein
VGIRDTLEDVLYGSTLPGHARGTAGHPVACEQMIETTAAEFDGASGMDKQLIEPLTRESDS